MARLRNREAFRATARKFHVPAGSRTRSALRKQLAKRTELCEHRALSGEQRRQRTCLFIAHPEGCPSSVAMVSMRLRTACSDIASKGAAKTWLLPRKV